MDDTQAEALGRRYLAAGGEWHGGMLARGRYPDGDKPWSMRVDCGGYGFACVGKESWAYVIDKRVDGESVGEPWPDFRDPAALGCLVAEVRERRKEPGMFAAPQYDTPHDHWWVVCIGDEWENHVKAGGPTEAEAWIAALEAAP